MTHHPQRVEVEDIQAALVYHKRSGTLTWLTRTDRPVWWNTRYAGQPAGTRHPTGYLTVKLNERVYYAHVLAYVLVHSTWPPRGLDIDHRNRNRADNRWTNLRLATRSQNLANSRKHRDGSNFFKGVTTSGNRFQARICVEGKRYHLGYFDTAQDASNAYVFAASLHFQEFTYAGQQQQGG